ncbi:hypothetical protein Tco_0232832 [Tanacetum coccineum]
MAVVRFHCPFVGLSGCQDGGGNGLTKTSLIIQLRDRHCKVMRETLAESSPHLSDVDEEDIDLGELNIKQYQAPFQASSLIPTYIYAQHLVDCLSGADVAISDELVSSITQVLVKPCGGIRHIAVGTIWRRLVSMECNMIWPIFGLVSSRPSDGGLRVNYKGWTGCDLHLNVDKTKVFWPKEDPRSRLAGIFPPNIARPLHGVKLLDGPASVDFDFCNELVMKRVAKTIGLMDAIAKINDPQCELLLLRSYTGISRLYFTMRTCPPRFFESAQCSFDVALRSSLEHIVTASGPGFGDWQWRLATLPFTFGGIGVYSAGDVLNYAFLASRLQSANLQTKLLRHTGIVSPGPIFDDALSVFNTSMETDLLSNLSEIAAPKLMKKMANIYFTRVTKNAESTFFLSSRKMALWASQREDHTSDWLRTVPISGLGQTMNGKTYRCVLCYRLGILAGKKVDIGLDGGRDKPLHPTDMLLYSWDEGLDVCVDLTGSSPLTQTGMVDFVLDWAVIDVAHPKRDKYMAKCAAIGYEFLPFSSISLGELEAYVVTLLKRIRKFSMTQNIGAHAAVHIFNMISFAIAKGVRPK